jgi:hypothetical protein
MKALWDFFPGMGPSMNRMAGINGVMERIAVAREQQRDQGTARDETATHRQKSTPPAPRVDATPVADQQRRKQ